MVSAGTKGIRLGLEGLEVKLDDEVDMVNPEASRPGVSLPGVLMEEGGAGGGSEEGRGGGVVGGSPLGRAGGAPLRGEGWLLVNAPVGTTKLFDEVEADGADWEAPTGELPEEETVWDRLLFRGEF